jgi:hypothetical protein
VTGAGYRREVPSLFFALAAATASVLLAGAGCTGNVGTVNIAIVTAPGSTLLDPVIRLRATLSSPVTVVEAERGPNGFGLELEVDADARSAIILLEGFDAAGVRVAVGATPPLPLVAFDADIAIYMAAPQSLAAAPVALDPPRSELGSVLLPYGVLLAGGATATGATADLDIYSAYDHAFLAGEDLPAPRRGVSVGFSTSGYAYLFGGADEAGAPTGTAWRFDTNAQPAGLYLELDDELPLARAGEVAAPLGLEQFLVTGTPPVVLNGFTGVAALTTLTELPPVAVSVQNVLIADAPVYTIIAGEGAGSDGISILVDGSFGSIAATAAQRSGHAAVPTPGAGVVVIGGGTVADGLLRSAIRIDPAARDATTTADVLATPRNDAAVATNGEVLVVAGGTDGTGALVPDAELIDLSDFTPIGTLPMLVPRTKATARPLPNGQIMIVGGIDAAGAPVGTVELFTPNITPIVQ